jgi:hypothetical protein
MSLFRSIAALARARLRAAPRSTPSPSLPVPRQRATDADPAATGWVQTLGRIVEHTGDDEVVRKSDLGFGDQVIVTTRNSVYSLWPLGDGTFAVSGGWFDQRDASPATITVNGCTYGGSAIRQDVLAGRGLFLEFGNNVSTTRIRRVRVLRGGAPQAAQASELLC